MAKILDTQKLVYECLVNDPSTRVDDYLLILAVLKNFITPSMSLEAVFQNHNILGIPSMETITRCRRKLQEKHPELVNEYMQEQRINEETEYIQYALNLI